MSVRHRNRRIEETIRDLENKLGRSAADAEVAVELGISVEEYNKRIQDMASSAILSLEDLWARPEDTENSLRTPEIRDDRARDPLDEAEGPEEGNLTSL